MFPEFLQPSILMKLASITICAAEHTKDQVGWLKFNNNKFTVTSVISYLQEQAGKKMEWMVKNLAFEGPKNNKVFIWVLAHDKILTNMARWRRGLVTSPTCSRYAEETESPMQAIRDCIASNEVWNFFGPP